MGQKLLGAAFAVVVGAASTSTVWAADLTVETYNPTTDGIFPVTSALISGDEDAILVDAQFDSENAERVVEMINDSGKNLEYIFISYDDPDYYFGLDTITAAFPDAQVIATPQTAWLIDASKDGKLEEWRDDLGDNAPNTLITPNAYTEDTITLEGEEIVIKKALDDLKHSYLWIPSIETALGGGSTQKGGHLWLADTPGEEGLNDWLNRIDDIAALNPQQVIPPHYTEEDFDPALLDENREYIEDFKLALQENNDAEGVVDDMLAKYPDIGAESSLEMSAGVLTGEIPWQVATLYPPVGLSSELTLGDSTWQLDFIDHRNLQATGPNGSTFTTEYHAQQVGENVFKVDWTTEDGIQVTSVENWDTQEAWTNVTSVDGEVTRHEGEVSLD